VFKHFQEFSAATLLLARKLVEMRKAHATCNSATKLTINAAMFADPQAK
jgi:hypothetical protein